MYKISKYIETVPFNDKKLPFPGLLVFSTRTEQMRVIKLEDWDFLQKNNINAVDEKIVEELNKIKVLVPSDEDEFVTITKENLDRDEYDKGLYTTIMVTANCPFGCDYCGQKHSSQLLDLESQNLLVGRLEEKLKEKKFRALHIGWFGGEPILGIDVINNLSPLLQKLAETYGVIYRAQITTNGYLLNNDVIKNLITIHNISEFCITLDGVGEIHDKRRCLKSKAPTFKVVYENLQNLIRFSRTLQKKIDITVRCNVDIRNENSAIELVRKLKADGLEKDISMRICPIHNWGNDLDEIVLEQSNFAQIEINVFVEMMQLGFDVKCLPQRRYGMCLATSKYSEMIDPYGQVFPCSEVGLVPTYVKNGENIYKIDDLKNKYGKISYVEKRSQFVKNYNCAQQKSNLVCRNCNVFPACLGMCPKQWNDGVIPCPTSKYNLKEKLLLHYIMERDKLLQVSAER